eukprot:767916-Hanusia_phi.AAC.4
MERIANSNVVQMEESGGKRARGFFLLLHPHDANQVPSPCSLCPLCVKPSSSSDQAADSLDRVRRG